MSDCCAAAQREVAYLLGECDKATMEIDLLRATVRRQTMTDLARQVPLAHERIALLADEHLQRVQAAARQPLQGETERRRAVLALLDGVHALRHVLEHHHEREHMALAHELPLDVQRAAWEGVPG